MKFTFFNNKLVFFFSRFVTGVRNLALCYIGALIYWRFELCFKCFTLSVVLVRGTSLAHLCQTVYYSTESNKDVLFNPCK